MKKKLLMVDDDRVGLFTLKFPFEAEYDVELAFSGEEALNLLKENYFDVAIIDFRMPGMNGLELLEKIKEQQDNIVCIMLTAEADFNLALEAGKKGAAYFVTKPYDAEQLKFFIQKGLEEQKLRHQIEILKKQQETKNLDELFIGESPKIKELKKQIMLIKDSPSTILILGETGTGKEIVASAINKLSQPQNGIRLFVPVNCGAIAETLLESELFGHEKGSFTGADRLRKGYFEQAGDGDLFLDEIGDVSPKVQASLLRALQEKVIRRVGNDDTKKIPVHCRVIAATNKNLKKMVEENQFRDDLYNRLKVIQLAIPPLRERKEDLPLLVAHLISKLNKKLRKKVEGISSDVHQIFINYDWPGNIRELENILERMMNFCDSTILDIDDVPSDLSKGRGFLCDTKEKSLDDLKKDYEKAIIKARLMQCSGVVLQAAKSLKIDEAKLRYRIRTLAIEKPIPDLENRGGAQ